jgi:hypothetical protein
LWHNACFSLLSLLWINKRRLMRSTRYLCICVYPSIPENQNSGARRDGHCWTPHFLCDQKKAGD